MSFSHNVDSRGGQVSHQISLVPVVRIRTLLDDRLRIKPPCQVHSHPSTCKLLAIPKYLLDEVIITYPYRNKDSIREYFMPVKIPTILVEEYISGSKYEGKRGSAGGQKDLLNP
jgi:hypothetical protein